MKFSAVLIASLTGATYGFAPSMQARRISPLFMADTASRPVTTPATNIDKSLDGIDGDSATFDPTEGDNAALTRNNKDEVWVQQVRLPSGVIFWQNHSLVVGFLTVLFAFSSSCNREPALVATANPQPCVPWFVSPL